MEIEEADSIYSNEISKANEFYITGLKDKIDKKKLEDKYKKRLLSARDKYNANVVKILKSKKNEKKVKKKENKPQEEDTNKKYHRPFLKDLKIKISVFYFKMSIRLKIIKEKIVPDWIFYSIKKNKLKTRNKIKSFLNNISRLKSYIVETYTKTIENIKKFYSKIFEKIKSKFISIKNYLQEKMKRKKEEPKKEEQSSEQKNLEKKE